MMLRISFALSMFILVTAEKSCQDITCGPCEFCVDQREKCFRSNICFNVPTEPKCQKNTTCEQKIEKQCEIKDCGYGYKCALDLAQKPRCIADMDLLEQRRICLSRREVGCCKPKERKWRYMGREGQGACGSFEHAGNDFNPMDKNFFDTAEECENKCKNVSVCLPKALDGTLGKDCVIDNSILGLDSCPVQTMMCPDLGCGRRPCKPCEICKNVFPKHCPEEDDGQLCKPNGHFCERDPVCEKWKCDATNCPSHMKCKYDKFWNAPICVDK